MTVMIPALMLGFVSGILAAIWATWRLDWVLMRERPELHREWQLGRMWIVWRSPDVNRRLRALGDARVTRLLNEINAASLFSMMVFGVLVVLALGQTYL